MVSPEHQCNTTGIIFTYLIKVILSYYLLAGKKMENLRGEIKQSVIEHKEKWLLEEIAGE